METLSILASLGLNPVWFTSISKLTDGSYPDYDQVCRPPQLNHVGPPWSSLNWGNGGYTQATNAGYLLRDKQNDFYRSLNKNSKM